MLVMKGSMMESKVTASFTRAFVRKPRGMTSDESAGNEPIAEPAAPTEDASADASAVEPSEASAAESVERSAITEPPAAEPAPKTEPPRRFSALLALGFSLANVGFLAWASIAISVLTTLGAIAYAIAMSREDAPPLASLPGVTASALAWGGGFLFAVAASARAFDRDEKNGIRQLVRARGVSLVTYTIGRVFGLAITLSLIVGIGSLVTGGVCALLAQDSRMLVGRATLATLVYALAFGFLVAPLAAATLGARARGAGYLMLIAVLVIPESLQDSLDSLPDRWRALFGIPSAMGTLRDSLTPAHLDLPLAGAALVVVILVSLVALLFSVEQALRASRAAEPR
jgi:ABC-type transport system involved in cytochrome c biogenesis permease component